MVNGTLALDDAHDVRSLAGSKGWAILAKRFQEEIEWCEALLHHSPDLGGEPLREWEIVKLQEQRRVLQWVMRWPGLDPEELLNGLLEKKQ